MKIPYSFNDITLSQFMQLHKIHSDKAMDKLDKLSILTGKSFNDIEELDFNTRSKLLAKARYMDNVPKDLRVPKRFTAGTTMLVPTMSIQEMKVNQLVDFYTIMKAHENDFIAGANDILAIMFKPFKLFGKAKYSPDDHSKISKLLLSAKVGDCLGLLFFYLNLWKRCEQIIVRYLENNQKEIQTLMNEIANDKEYQAFLANGGGNTI
jgi:hypothetical protein